MGESAANSGDEARRAAGEINERQRERAEVETILGSEVFKRAPSLRQIFAYVCERYFAGEAAKIKEYNIAVEAIGRGPGFDANSDTIVRVEASRLRKRLKEYYAGEGADHAVRIALPGPGYIPQFIHRQDAPAPSPLEAESPEEPVRRRPRWPRLAAAFCVLVSVAAGWGLLSSRLAQHKREDAPPSLASIATIPGTPASDDGGVRILAGLQRPQFVDSLGHIWHGDRYFSGGRDSELRGGEIFGVLDPVIYRTSRIGDFRYDIPLKPGVYEMRLLLVETEYGKGDRTYWGEASRVFDVEVNGVRRLRNVDILADAGAPYVPADRVLTDISPGQDGFVHLAFRSAAGSAALSGIEIVPGLRGRMKPVRILAGGRSYYDSAGNFWGADRYFYGGRPTGMTTNVVRGTADPALYANGRWGRFTYSIPVAPEGSYRATLKFAETYFGPTNQGRTGAGSRVYDIYCNGIALLRNFDVLKETSENTAMDKVFQGLKPTAQGRLVFSFAPVRSYASVHSIEIVDERP